jgi:hypothetical protein
MNDMLFWRDHSTPTKSGSPPIRDEPRAGDGGFQGTVVRCYSNKVPSKARVAASAFGFLTFIQVFDWPERYGASSFFETIPSRPILPNADIEMDYFRNAGGHG